MINNHQQAPVVKDIVLVGGGHSHVGVIKMIAKQNPDGVRLTLICTDTDTPYSGMLPGYIAGHYSFDEVHIDLRRLCALAGARFVKAKVTHIDKDNKRILCENRPAIGYDVLSINIGSTPQVHSIPGAQGVVIPVKPIAQFNQHWLRLIERVELAEKPLKIAVVGGGAGGVELLLAMHYRFNASNSIDAATKNKLTFALYTTHDLLPTHNAKVRNYFKKQLQEKGVEVHLNTKIESVSPNTLHTSKGQSSAADEIIWVTQAGAPNWLQKTGLSLNEKGFIRVKNTLQTFSDDTIFAAGDVAEFSKKPLEKAGIFAVRMSKPLAKNLLAMIQDKPLKAYKPQNSWLALISTGEKFAVASKGKVAFWGQWVWRWKNWIDQRFMNKFNNALELANNRPTPNKLNCTIATRHGVCDTTVGSNTLRHALAGLKSFHHPDVLAGLNSPNNAAIIRVPNGKVLVHSTDFSRAMIDDPFLFSKIAANQALGNIYAMGAQPQTASAIVTMPPGHGSKTEQLLFEMMQGAVDVLNKTYCTIVDCHLSEGKELALGFAINGLISENLKLSMTKGALKPGDAIIITKPIGTGILFAALPQGKAKGRWIDNALLNIQVSNQQAARSLLQFGCVACTNMTDLGVLGHLLEMTKASNVEASLNLSQIPYLPGALECVEKGIVSSLQESNLRLRSTIRNQSDWVNDLRYPLLFDPQTAGGLLAAIPSAMAEHCIQDLIANNYPHAHVIGIVSEKSDHLEPITLED